MSIVSDHIGCERIIVRRPRPFEPWRRSVFYIAVSVWAWLAFGGSLLAEPGEAGLVKAREAAVALARGDAGAAEALYDAALTDASLPADRRVAIYTDRGVARARLGLIKEAIEDFNQAIRLAPEGAAAYNNRGNLLLALGIVEEALKDFDRAIVLAPGYAAAYNNRALARLLRGDTVAALRDFTRAIKLAPSSPAPLDGRARSELLLGRPYTAITDVTRAIALDARFGPAYRTRAEAHLAIGRYQQAIEDLSRASAFEPANPEILLLRARAYLEARDHAAAVKDFERVAELTSPTAAVLTDRARAEVGLEAHDAALTHLTRAIEIDPRDARAFAYRARVYTHLQQFEAAARDAEHALALDAKLAAAHWALGEVHLAAERPDAAATALRTAVDLDPALGEAREALSRLGHDVGPVGEIEHPDRGHGPWSLIASGMRFSARHAEQMRLRIPLEVIKGHMPRLLAWEVASGPYEGIGILRYAAGVLDAPGGAEDVEMAALVELNSSELLALLPVRQGPHTAQWQWEPGRLTVTTHEGLVRDIALRDGRRTAEPMPPATTPGTGRRVADAPTSKKGGAPAWAPWNESHSYKSSGSRDQGRSGGSNRKPKTLFDLLFGN